MDPKPDQPLHKSPTPTNKNAVTKDKSGVTSNASTKSKPKRKQKGALGLLMQYDSDSGGSAASVDSDSTSTQSISPLSCTTPSPPLDRLLSPTTEKGPSPLAHALSLNETNNNTKPKKRAVNKTNTGKKKPRTKTPKYNHDASGYVNHNASRFINHETSGYVNLGDTVSGVQHLKNQRSQSPAVVSTAASINPQLTSQAMYPSTGIPGYSLSQGHFPFQSGNYSYPPTNYQSYLNTPSQQSSGFYQWAGSYPSMPCQSSFPYLNFSNNGSRNAFR